MRKSVFLLITILAVMFTACDKNDDPKVETDNTSFVVKNTVDAEYRNVVAGYFKDGKCKKIATIGDMAYNQISTEFIISNSDITEVFLFITQGSGDSYKLTPGYKLEKGKKNTFNIIGNMQPVTAKENDDTQYPH